MINFSEVIDVKLLDGKFYQILIFFKEKFISFWFKNALSALSFYNYV